MRRFPLRRALGSLLSFALVASAPGAHSYQAFAQSVGGRSVGAGTSARVVPVRGLSVLASPIPSLSPSTLLAPAIAPSPQLSPLAASVSAPAISVAAAAVPMGPAAMGKTGPSSVAAPSVLTRGLSIRSSKRRASWTRTQATTSEIIKNSTRAPRPAPSATGSSPRSPRASWEADGTPRALTDEEKDSLRKALAAAERAVKGFAPGSGLHGFAPLALAALPAMGIAPILIFAAVGLGIFYLIWRMLPAATDAGSSTVRESIPASVAARHRRLALSARRMATAVNGGSFRSRFIGPGGTDFAEARPYQGEDMREVDWKTSAKKDELYAKKFELERDMPLMLVIDLSKSGRFGTTGTDKRTAIEDAAAVLALAAAHSNIRVGAILVSDKVEKIIPARGGSRHAMLIVDEILKGEPTGTATDLKPGLEAAGKLLGSRAMVAVLSDFIAPDFKDALGAIASRHDVRAIRVTDPAEMSPLPDVGLLPVVDAETGATRMLDTSSKAGRSQSASAIANREAAVEAAFDASRLRPILISTEGDPLESLELAFHPKARQPANH